MHNVLANTPRARFDDPRMILAEQQLGKILTQFMGAPITESVIKLAEETVEEWRAHCRIHGLNVPPVRVVAFPKAGYIQVWPVDMTDQDFKIRVKNLLKGLQDNNRNCDPNEIAKALRRAYPEYSPSASLIKLG